VNKDLHSVYSQEYRLINAIAVFSFESPFQHYRLKEALIPGIDYYWRYGTDSIVGLLQVQVLWLVDGVSGFNQAKLVLPGPLERMTRRP